MRIEKDKGNIDMPDRLLMSDKDIDKIKKREKDMQEWGRKCEEEFKSKVPLHFP